MSKSYNVAVIGYGWAAGAHIGAINATKQAKVTAVWSSRPLSSAELSARHGSPITAHSDLEAMLGDPALHVVDITSYPDQHAAQFISAARHGKHVIVEKPIAVEWRDILAMKKAVKETGVKTCVCFECRYSSQFVATKAVLDSGLVGRLHYGEVDYYHGIGPWYGQYRVEHEAASRRKRAPDRGMPCARRAPVVHGRRRRRGHELRDAERESAVYALRIPNDVDEILKFVNGSVGKCAAVVDCLQPYYFHTHLVGSDGSILDNKFHSQKLAGLNRHAWSELSMKLLDSGDVGDHPYQTQFQAFFDALDEGKRHAAHELWRRLRVASRDCGGRQIRGRGEAGEACGDPR